MSFNVKYFRQKSKLYTDNAGLHWEKEINSYLKVTQSFIGCIFVLPALQIQDSTATICVHFHLHMSISVTTIQLQNYSACWNNIHPAAITLTKFTQ